MSDWFSNVGTAPDDPEWEREYARMMASAAKHRRDLPLKLKIGRNFGKENRETRLARQRRYRERKARSEGRAFYPRQWTGRQRSADGRFAGHGKPSTAVPRGEVRMTAVEKHNARIAAKTATALQYPAGSRSARLLARQQRAAVRRRYALPAEE